MVCYAGKLTENLKLFKKAIEHTFFGFTGVITHLGLNYSPSARDLKAFRVFSQNPK